MTTTPASGPLGSPLVDSRGAPPGALHGDDVRRAAEAVVANIERVVSGRRDDLVTALTVLVAEGHLLVEGVPGVGKTVLAKALARSVGSSLSRIQFTSDLLPGDVLGVSVYNQGSERFEFTPGPIFANIVIADEINRASPKTQSALLECMEERQVTVDGQTRRLARPFFVLATQNPIEMEGTYALPEAQRDRFMARIEIGYPDEDAELEMLERNAQTELLDSLDQVVSETELRGMMDAARRIHVSPAVRRYVVAIVRATRDDEELWLGASPRGGLQLLTAAKARAALEGRTYVLPDDVDALAAPVLGHRLLTAGHRDDTGLGPSAVTRRILARIIEATPVPVAAMSRE